MSDEVIISKSKQKREQRKKEVEAARKKKNWDAIIGWLIGIVIAAVVIGTIVMGIVSSVGGTVSSSDFSEGLTSEGYIDGANLSKVKDLGLDSLVISLSDVEYTDDEVEDTISSALSAAAYFSDDTSLITTDGDTINLDYVGYVDGIAFEGGNTNGEGAELTLGSGSYIDTFEEQLIGYHPGDSVTVEVTFPDPYESNTDLSGKDATFECVINSIETIPELTDEWVAENYEDYSTVEELRAGIKADGQLSNVETYISDYINDNASATAPRSYVKHLRQTLKYSDEQSYEYYNSYFYYYYGSYVYSDFSDYTGMTDSDYEKYLKENAKTQASIDMTYEAYYRNAGLSCDDEYAEIVEYYGGDDAIETYGEGYLRQIAIKYTVIDYLAEKVTIQ